MDQRTRMWKTLGCLAAAMTGTAVFLGWTDPSQPPRSRLLTAAQIAQLTRSLVNDSVVISREQWREIEVVGAASTVAAPAMLAASADTGECHFYIDESGRPSRARRWTHQTPPLDAPHTVRIHVAPAGRSRSLTSTQRACLRGLVVALNDALAHDGSTLPVHVRQEFDLPGSDWKLLQASSGVVLP